MLLAVLGLVIVSCASEASQADGPDLTEAHGCGHGFYVSDLEQTTGLVITYRDREGAMEGRVAPNSDLDVAWDAELQRGTNLFANWCDDVIEPGEPTPEIEETWDVTGRIEVTGLPGAGECGPASAELTDVVATGPDGEELVIGDLSVVNEAWGCFAG